MNASDVLGAVFSPDDGRVNPTDLCAALEKGARARGARLFEDTTVTGILTEAGKAAGIETPRGAVRCDAIALCAGLWSRRIAGMAGVSAPVWPCEHFYLLTKPVPGAERPLPTLSDHDSGLYIRDESQGLLVGCFEPLGKPIDPARLGEDFAFRLLPEDWEHFEPMMARALHRLPILETAEVRMLLNGPESFTPDGAFLLGEAAETRGFFVGCGMNSVGVATAGGAGMALANCIVHGHTPSDLAEADPKRFSNVFNSAAALAARVPEVLGRHYEIAYPGRQFASARRVRTAPLEPQWRAAKAHFGQVYGWERPLYFAAEREPLLTFGKPEWFEQVGVEVRRAHEHAAVFDLSTFGKIRVEGPDAETFLDRVCANTMRRPPGRAVYTAMLNERGTFESDLTALRLSDESYRLTVGTAAIKRDMAWLRWHLTADERVRLTDETETYAVLGLVGPEAAGIVKSLGAEALTSLGYFCHGKCELAGVPVGAVRLSYVGEAGWELTCLAEDAGRLYEALYEAGARPSGLLAQTSMRIEKRYLAMGHDLGADVTPLEAGLDFALCWDKPFFGRGALLERRETGVSSRMAAIVLDDPAAVPLGGEPVYAGGRIAGTTSSAAFGYRISKPVALAYLDLHVLGAAERAGVEIDIARQTFTGTVLLEAPFDPKGLRIRSTSLAAASGV